jgi:MFS transporter, PHS family, inorganic phosphate transporter
MAAVFAMQGFGQLAGALVMLFVTLGFKQSLLTAATYAKCTGVCSLAVDKMWRTLIGTESYAVPEFHCFTLTVVFRTRSRASLRRSLLPSNDP